MGRSYVFRYYLVNPKIPISVTDRQGIPTQNHEMRKRTPSPAKAPLPNGWIKAALKEQESTQRELAEAMGITEPRMSEIVKGERGVEAIEAAKMASHLQMPIGEVIRRLPGGKQLKAVPISSVMVIGAVQAGVFKEAMEWPRDQWRPAPMAAFEGFPGLRQFGLEVRGTSMNKEYPIGSIVVCVKWFDAGVLPTTGQRVIVLRRNPLGTDEFEATVKELEIDDEGAVWLWPRSTDPQHQQPLRVDSLSQSEDNDDIRIVGLVIGSYRPENPAAKRTRPTTARQRAGAG